jgi:hypothetical protein
VPCGTELDFQSPFRNCCSKFGVLADVGRDHAADLPVREQDPESEVVDAAVVADDGELLRPARAQRGDQVLGDAAEPKPPTMRVAPSGMSATAIGGARADLALPTNLLAATAPPRRGRRRRAEAAILIEPRRFAGARPRRGRRARARLRGGDRVVEHGAALGGIARRARELDRRSRK